MIALDAQRSTIDHAGVHMMGGSPLSNGIDEKTGVINVFKLCPEPGDSIMIVNCGTHFELRHQHWEPVTLSLTEEELEGLRQGIITWN